MKKWMLIALVASMGLNGWAAPELKRVGNKALLHVDGKPCILLGGQVMNSSSFDLEYMKSIWNRLEAFHLNTLIVPISWQAVEPVEGQFDFHLVGELVRQARDHEMKLVILWFGSWKNGMSGYVPGWVISDMERFKRMERGNGQRLEVISNLSAAANAADSKAFAAFMHHLKRIDEKDQTVLMVQVQNEVGLLGDSRDRSPEATAAFSQSVPDELMSYLDSNRDQLKPHLQKVMEGAGNQRSGSWNEVFGNGVEADEIFMAWHYARYIDRMAAAGRAEYNLPLIVNAWLAGRDGVPGTYPSGGPVAKMMDIWKAGAPNIELMAADIYGGFKDRCAAFSRADNALFIPESNALWLGDRWSSPAKAFYSIAEAQAIGFAPFGIDHAHYEADHPIGQAYEALGQLTPLIVEHFGTDRLRGFFKENEEEGSAIVFDRYRCQISYESKLDDCYGLIIQLAADEFIVAGNGAHVQFVSNIEGRTGVSVCQIEEGRFGEDGRWVRSRFVAGDEALGAGTKGIKLPPLAYGILHDKNNFSIQRIKLYLHPVQKGKTGVPDQGDGMPAEGIFN